MSGYIVLVIVTFSLSAQATPSQRFDLNKSSHDFKFYSRADWGASPPENVKPLKHPVPYVVIHHTYLPAACDTFEDCAAKMHSMQNYHKSLDWGDIGYSFCVGSEGGVYEGRGWDTVGIHAGPANSHSVGLCLIGDWTEQVPPADQIDATKALIAEGVNLGKIDPDYKLGGHNQVMNTECPGAALFAEISTWAHFAPGKPDFTKVFQNSTVSSVAAKS